MKPATAAAAHGKTASPPAVVSPGDGSERGREVHVRARDNKKQPPQHGKAGGDRNREKEKQPSLLGKKDKKRDLSPSVAAMFEAVSASQQSSSDVVSDDTDTPPEEGPSAALKSMLNIQGAYTQ